VYKRIISGAVYLAFHPQADGVAQDMESNGTVDKM